MDTLQVGDRSYSIFRLDSLQASHDVARLPYSLRILLENVFRQGDETAVEAVATWDAKAAPSKEISFQPARTLHQDFTGVPVVVDLASMRDAMRDLGGDPSRINPQIPSELVIDHSVQVDEFATSRAFARNAELEFERNRERYALLRWAQGAFDGFTVVPPSTGICHQVNLEYLGRVVESRDGQAFPDTLLGTDSHTTMINGLGVLGWGVGGIEAEAAMLGQAVSMLVPQVVGFRLTGALPEGATATDLVLTVTERLRRAGVVGKFVEYFGHGLAKLPVADRATLGNMSPEYGATCGFFPVDEVTLDYLRLTGRPEERVALVEAYCKENLLWHDPEHQPTYSQVVELDLGDVEPSLAGPRRPQDRVPLTDAKRSFLSALETFGVDYGNKHDEAIAESFPASDPAADAQPGHEPVAMPAPVQVPDVVVAERARAVPVALDGRQFELEHGAVVIAAITSCTNTSNPSVMLAAGLLAKKAAERGLERKPWVKTSLAPGSKVVTDYYERAGLTQYLEELGFNLVGYGCTTCIGNSGPLPMEISDAIQRRRLVACSVLSGNRNFEGRINSDVRANYLMSPPLVVAFALAGRIDIDLYHEPLGHDRQGVAVYLRDIWPTSAEVEETLEASIKSDMYRRSYGAVFSGDERWNGLEVPGGDRFEWSPSSTYVRQPPYFKGMSKENPASVEEIRGARVIAVLGDSVTTDHISPAGSIRKDSPAGRYLVEQGVKPADFNSYGSRRGNHEVLVRGTFANTRIRNRLAPNTEGGFTTHWPTGEVLPIYDAAMRYQAAGTPLLILAGKEYGSGSSRDWAAKGPALQGIRSVIAESYERIHRSNLVGMGILPLQFEANESAETLGLTGHEIFDFEGLTNAIATGFKSGRTLRVRARREDGSRSSFSATIRIDTPQEVLYYQHGGILPYVLRQLLWGRQKARPIGGGPAATPAPVPSK